MLYRFLAKMLDALRERIGISPCLLGLALSYSHVDLLYPLASAGYSESLLASDVVSVVAFAVVALAARRFISLGRSSFVLAAALLCSVVGTCVLFFEPLSPGLFAGAALMAVGYTLLYLLWLELYGCLAPRQVATAVAGSLILHIVLQGFINALTGVAGLVVALCLPALSLLMYVEASRKLTKFEWPTQSPRGGFAPFALVALWVALFGLATGLSRYADGTDAAGTLALASRILPAIALLVGTILLSDRFDFKVLYRTAAPIIAAGVVITVLGNSPLELGAFLVGMGSEACTLVMVVIGCGIAYMTRSSGMYWAGMLVAIECAGFALGSFLRAAISSHEAAFVLAVCLAVAFLAVTVVLFRRDSLVSEKLALGRILDLRQSKYIDVQGFVEQASSASGLSPAEASVLALLAQGATRAEISERLFIAPVTVRVHLSRLCKKMGFSSSGDLEEYLAGRHLR